MAAHYAITYGLSMTSVLESELEHNLGLMADILSYGGVEPFRVIDWFQGKGPIYKSPIAIWEYVFLRYALLGRMRFILDQAPDMRITPQLAQELREIDYMDQTTIQLIPKLMANRGLPKKLPYTTVDLVFPMYRNDALPAMAMMDQNTMPMHDAPSKAIAPDLDDTDLFQLQAGQMI
jgi:hypothetical protein